jgi:mRNA interferase RelE/StbE
MSYTVRFSPAAARVFDKLSPEVKRRLGPKIDELASDPRPPAAKALQGQADLMALRVGEHRVLYRIRDAILEVLVVRVAHRREVYRRL